MFQVEKKFEKTYDGITYRFELSDDKFYDGYYSQRWEGSTLEVVIDGKSYKEPFILYSNRGVKFAKVAKAVSRVREAECVYFVDMIFGDNSIEVRNRFKIFVENRKGMWNRYHKENTHYVEGENNSVTTRKFIQQYEARKEAEAKVKEFEQTEKMSKFEKTSELVNLARMTDTVVNPK